MNKERASLGFGEELDDFNPAEWAAKPKPSNDRPPPIEAKKVAEASGFRSREPKAAEPIGAGQGSAPPRRRRTGRNAQLNLKARPETIEAFYEIADRQQWGLGETLEQAVQLLKREYPAQG